MIAMQDRYRGALAGLACGDAIGTTAEFRARGTFAVLTDMVGGGPFDLKPGAWTDDTSMALCLAHSLLYRQGFDPVDQMNRYCNWYNWGYMSSTGECFDIGNTTAQALRRYLDNQDPFAGSTDAASAGNGGLMRLAPVPMYYADDETAVFRYAGDSTRTTHGAQEAIECSRLFGLQLRAALRGGSKEAILSVAYPEPLSARVASIANRDFLDKPAGQIKGSGYCVESLEAALWCFWHTASFKDAVLKAANLGDDADTTAAICGQLAGACYGVQDIPEAWMAKLAMGSDILALADRLLAERYRIAPPASQPIIRIHGESMHIKRIHFDEVFDAQPGPGNFSFSSHGQTQYAVHLRRGLIPQAGAAYLIAFATPGDWSTLLGWLDLQSGTSRLKDMTWLAMLDEIGALAWLAPFLLGGVLLFAGPAAALAALLGLLGYAGLRLAWIARRGQRVLRALAAARLDVQAVPAGAAGERPLH